MKIAIFEDNDIDYMALVKRIDNFLKTKMFHILLCATLIQKIFIITSMI